jgi:UDP-3-O-[3-hydroxymyristoyl] glucosamine N-acyltransferase
VLGALADYVGAELSGSICADLQIKDLATLDAAEISDLSLFSSNKYRDAATRSRAGAIITTRKLGVLLPGSMRLLYVANPHLAFTNISYLFYPSGALQPGIHTTAVVDPGATIGRGCQIDAGAKVGRAVTLGSNCHIGANVVIDCGVSIGDECIIGPNTSIRNALMGSHVHIASNACIGGEGFGFVTGPKGVARVRQLGRVIIGDNVEIGSNSSVDRGALGDTVIGSGTVIDNLVQIAHNVQIGRNCVLAGQVGIAGSAKIGDNVYIGGRSAICDHVTIGSNVRVAGGSGVMRDAVDSEILGGYPAVPIRQWHRQTTGLARLFGRCGQQAP